MKVSIVIPCLNEEKYIGQCLDSILQNDYPNNSLEIFVVDGNSDDQSRRIVQNYSEKYSFIHLLDNPKRLTPVALNIGIRAATGDVIVRMDAHTRYKEDYIVKSVEYLNKHKAVNVGGIIKTLPGKPGIIANAIALAISHFFGVGLSHFRIGVKKIQQADTVPFGCFRKDIFTRVGYFDESQARNEDIDMNWRIRNIGEKILLCPDIISYYYARGTIMEFVRHNFHNGYLVTATWDTHTIVHSMRHIVPLLVAMTCSGLLVASFYIELARKILLGLALLYSMLSLYFSCKTAMRQKNPVYLLIMPAMFILLHVMYALGSFVGLIKAVWSRLGRRYVRAAALRS